MGRAEATNIEWETEARFLIRNLRKDSIGHFSALIETFDAAFRHIDFLVRRNAIASPGGSRGRPDVDLERNVAALPFGRKLA